MRYSLLFLCLLLQACSPSQNSLVDTFKVAVKGPQDVVVSPQRIADIPYGSIYLTLPTSAQIFVVGYRQDGFEKWSTGDQVVFITQNGRLIRSAGYSAGDLLEVTNLQQDPLLHAASLHEGASWTRLMRWTENKQPLSSVVESRFSRQQDETLTLAGSVVVCQVWHEDVTLQTTGDHWQNTFWVDPQSGRVVKSEQRLGADMPVSITLLKPANAEIPPA
ncbi:group 4 capsule polysaccharide lipoprotein GfcB/YjbF [Rahnella sp. BIGb0236]|uniref:YjbF family lipoprotein n=1 Tax=Rahnella sp. BIGb0236 TaxID=2485117 RepID=UPI00105B74A7|nr:YjbF family lipoprotein [Rahnella sp. BIGb0236]TDS86231.1 group 4 capsule polysaccharide lipoprotein GfcB/YjbF [Rahnella sp. BIGb0236]